MFDPGGIVHLWQHRRAQAIELMDRLERNLADGRAVMLPPAHGIVDAVWTVFLARMHFVGLGAEIDRRPALARYWRAMQARPSFAAADVWTRMHPLRLIGALLGPSPRTDDGLRT